MPLMWRRWRGGWKSRGGENVRGQDITLHPETVADLDAIRHVNVWDQISS